MQQDDQANALGERLLEAAFPSKDSKDGFARGFYTHLNHASTFTEVLSGSPLHDRVVAALGLDFAIIDNQRIFGYDNYGTVGDFNEVTVTVVTDGRIVVGGFYDGDGDVIAADLVTSEWVENADMKSPYDWYPIEAPASDAKPKNSTASAIATRATQLAYQKQRSLLATLGRSVPHADGSYATGMDPDKSNSEID